MICDPAAGKVLLVEPSTLLRQTLRQKLVAEGFVVRAEAKLPAADPNWCPDVVVLGLAGPLDAPLAIQAQAHGKAVPPALVLMLSGGAGARVIALDDYKADDVTTRPISPRELALRLRAVLRRRRDLPLNGW